MSEHHSVQTTHAMAAPSVALEEVWLKFYLRYYRQRLTLRGEIVGGLSSLVRRRPRQRTGKEFWALRGVSFSLAPGEVLGVIGFNGSGKSTLLRVAAGIYAPDRGAVKTNGSIATLLSFGAGFDTRRSGRENVFNNGVLLGLSPRDIADRLDTIVELSGLGDFINAPVNTYSAGMRARLGFAIAVNADADIMLIDEVIGAGDERFRKRVGNIFDQLSSRQRTVVFVTHSMEQLRQYCTRALWLDEGRVHMEGPVPEVAETYLAAAREQPSVAKG